MQSCLAVYPLLFGLFHVDAGRSCLPVRYQRGCHWSHFMWKAAPLAWGLPVIPVLALLIYDPNLYLSQSDFCWMSLDAFYPAVMGPIVTIMLINFSLFLVVLKSVIAASKSNGLRSTQSSQLRTWYQFRMAICLFFLLGLTWIFGFLSISDARTVFAYLFCVFNSLHGFVIFVFFVLRKKNVRRLWSEFVGSEDVMSSSRKSQNTSSQLPDYTSIRVSKFY
ncbi:MAG: 7 transmembrane receptor [bacterium]